MAANEEPNEEPNAAYNRSNTELFDYSIVHSESEGPYSRNLHIDVVVVGAGFGKQLLLSRYVPFNSLCPLQLVSLC